MEIRNNISDIKFKGAIKLNIPKGSKNYTITKDLLSEIQKSWKPGKIGHIRNGDELSINFHSPEVERFSINYLKWRGVSNLSYWTKASINRSEFIQLAKMKSYVSAPIQTPLSGAIKMPIGSEFQGLIRELQRYSPKEVKTHIAQSLRNKEGTHVSIPLFSPEAKAFALRYLSKTKASNYLHLDVPNLGQEEFREFAS